MKIAVITEDGKTISQHFGRAPYYLVLTVENGKITERVTRAKAGHNVFAGPGEIHEEPAGPHGFDAESQSRHVTMSDPISDSQVLLAGGMGMGALQSLQARGIKVVMTDVKDIDTAVKLYIEGKLPDIKDRLH